MGGLRTMGDNDFLASTSSLTPQFWEISSFQSSNPTQASEAGKFNILEMYKGFENETPKSWVFLPAQFAILPDGFKYY